MKNSLTDPGTKYAFLTFITWSLYFSLIRIPVQEVGWFWSLYPSTFYFLPFLLLPKVKATLTHNKISVSLIIPIFLMALLGRTGDMTYNIALTKGYSSIVGAIAGTSPIFFVLLARFVFKQGLNLQQKIGIVICFTGIIILSLATL